MVSCEDTRKDTCVKGSLILHRGSQWYQDASFITGPLLWCGRHSPPHTMTTRNTNAVSSSTRQGERTMTTRNTNAVSSSTRQGDRKSCKAGVPRMVRSSYNEEYKRRIIICCVLRQGRGNKGRGRPPSHVDNKEYERRNGDNKEYRRSMSGVLNEVARRGRVAGTDGREVGTKADLVVTTETGAS